MRRKLLIGGLASAVLLAVSLVGVSYGRGDGITEPVVIELFTKGCSTNDHAPATDCHIYRLRDERGERTGEIARAKAPVRDSDGNITGQLSNVVVSAKGMGNIVTAVFTLKPGPYTERGTVTVVGRLGAAQPGAVTGGTGAYVNARGQVTTEGVEGGFHITLSLIP